MTIRILYFTLAAFGVQTSVLALWVDPTSYSCQSAEIRSSSSSSQTPNNLFPNCSLSEIPPSGYPKLPWTWTCTGTSPAPKNTNYQVCRQANVQFTNGVGQWTCTQYGTINQCSFGDCKQGQFQKTGPTSFTWSCTSTISSRSGNYRMCQNAIIDVNGLWTCTNFQNSNDLVRPNDICDDSCFSEKMRVHKLVSSESSDTVLHPIAQLSIGDTILDGDGAPTRVLGYLHAGSNPTQFIHFHLADGDVFSVTAEHLVYVNQGNVKYVKDITTHDLLDTPQGPISIERITLDSESGFFAPLTEAGTIAVGKNKIKASCYAYVSPGILPYLSWYFPLKRLLFGADYLNRPRFDRFWLSGLTWLGLAV